MSTVPKASLPASARLRAPETLSNIQEIFRGGEIGIDQQSGALLNERRVALTAELLAEIGGATVLPDDRIMDGIASFAIPDNRGLALVGDADGCDICRGCTPARSAPRVPRRFERRRSAPVCARHVRAGKDLIEFALGDGADGAVFVKEERP